MTAYWGLLDSKTKIRWEILIGYTEKPCYNEVNIVEAFAVFLFFLLNSMLASTLNSQTVLWRRQVIENPEQYSEQYPAVIVYVAKREGS